MNAYKITTGDLMFGGRVSMRGSITMRDPVDRAVLEQAVNLAATYLPSIVSELVCRDGRLWLRENGLPFVVAEGTDPLPLGSAAANGHELGFSCTDSRIYFSYNHIICDGHGFGMIANTVLLCYCRLRYGAEVQCAGMPPLEQLRDVGFSDPFSFVKLPKRPVPLISYPDTFRPPQEDLRTDNTICTYRIHVSKDALLNLIAPISGTPATLTALILCKAFDAVYPDYKDGFVVTLATDVRGALGCRSTLQNCLADTCLWYSDRVKRLPLDKQLTCFRGMLLRQTDPDYSMQRMELQRQQYEAKVQNRLAGIPEAPDDHTPGSLFVTYVGSMSRGELDQYCGKLVMDGAPLYPGFIGMTEEDGMFHLSLSSNLKTDDVYQRFLRELEALGLPYTTDPPEVSVLSAFE